MLDKKIVVKVAVKKPAVATKKPEPVKVNVVAKKVAIPVKSVSIKVSTTKATVIKPVVVAKPKAKPVPPVQNKLVNRLLNKPKIKESTEKKISKFLTDKIPKKMVQITKPNNSALLSMMQQNIGSALS